MMDRSLSSDTILKDLFTHWPAAMPVFIRHRMSCVGCSMSVFDTLGDAARNYDLDPARFVLEIKAAIDNRQEPASLD